MSNEKALEEWQEAVQVIAEALKSVKEDTKNKGYDYAVIGSGAYVLHGVKFEDPNDNPADIDITTTSPRATRNAIMALQESGEISVKEDPKSSLAVSKFHITFKNGKSYEFEFTHAEDFGFNSASLATKNNVQVTSLMETLLSIYLRPEHRIKDLIAFRDLIKNNADVLQAQLSSSQQLNPSFKAAVNTMLAIFADPVKASDPQLVDGTVAKILPRLGVKKAHNMEPKVSVTSQTLFAHQARTMPSAPPRISDRPTATRAPTSSMTPEQRQQRRLERLKEAEKKLKEREQEHEPPKGYRT
ncbi:hypothetical protein AQUSIP_08050 [Aquicella siphonis]|uniref:Nucleotidyltransferase n=1 Tax=Aquicella siphonis TaxID=254247 RepID=A0A5E4PFV2_9COXI|nr:hypothetical protein [Aquicella siphonis]VVC75515.1 hypothetical protein AQUSIP_08050 [Aquicella siphonis]